MELLRLPDGTPSSVCEDLEVVNIKDAKRQGEQMTGLNMNEHNNEENNMQNHKKSPSEICDEQDTDVDVVRQDSEIHHSDFRCNKVDKESHYSQSLFPGRHHDDTGKKADLTGLSTVKLRDNTSRKGSENVAKSVDKYPPYNFDTVECKATEGLAEMKKKAGDGTEQHQLLLFFNDHILNVISSGLGPVTLSPTQLERLDQIQNEAVSLILSLPEDLSCQVKRNLRNLLSIPSRHKLAQVKVTMKVSEDINDPLHSAFDDIKKRPLWMDEAINTIQQVCGLDELRHGKEWIKIPKDMGRYTNVDTTLEGYKKHSIDVPAMTRELIEKYSSPEDLIFFTDGSVKPARSAWAYILTRMEKIKHKDSGAYPGRASSQTMEMTAVSKALEYLAKQPATGVALIMSDSLDMLKKIKKGNLRSEWVDIILKSNLTSLTFIYTPGHEGVEFNEQADELARKAPLLEGRCMYRIDIENAVKAKLMEEDESPMATQLRELGIKRCKHGLTQVRINQDTVQSQLLPLYQLIL